MLSVDVITARCVVLNVLQFENRWQDRLGGCLCGQCVCGVVELVPVEAASAEQPVTVRSVSRCTIGHCPIRHHITTSHHGSVKSVLLGRTLGSHSDSEG